MIESRFDKALFKDIISTMYQGINTAADKVIYAEQGMPIIQSKHFTSGKLTLADTKFIGVEDVQKYGHKYIPEIGDILFSNIGTVGKSVVVDVNIDFMFAWNVFLIKLKTEKVFDLYLQYYLDYLLKRNAYEPWFTGGTVKFLNKKTIGNFNIPLPHLPEQQKIASILDAADSLRQKDQQLIEKYTALSQSLFLEMFGDPETNPMGWKKQPISNVCTDIVDCVNRTASVVAYETEYKMIRTTNVKNYKVDISTVRYVAKETYEKWIRRLTPKIGDIIFTREAPVGEAGILEANDYVFLGQRTMEYRVDKTLVNPYYLLYELMGSNVKKQIQKLSSGSTVKHLRV